MVSSRLKGILNVREFQLTIRQMMVFRSVMMTCSTTETAKQLNTTQPAISKMVSTTESIVGFRLFERTNRRLVPTPEASNLLPQITRLLGDLEVTQCHLDDLRDGYAGHIAIAGNQTLNATLATDAITRFSIDHPQVQIALINQSATQVVESVTEHRMEIGLVYAPAPPGDFSAIRLGAWSCVCVVRNDHPLASRAVIHPTDLMGHRIISYTDRAPTGIGIRQSLAESGLGGKIEVICNNTAAVLFLVDRGRGVGIVDTFSCFGENFPNLTSRPFRPEVNLIPTALVSSHASASPATQLFLEHLVAAGQAMTETLSD